MSIYRMLGLSADAAEAARVFVATGLAVVVWGAPALAVKAEDTIAAIEDNTSSSPFGLIDA